MRQKQPKNDWKKIVQFVFPNVSLLSTPKEFPINNDKIKWEKYEVMMNYSILLLVTVFLIKSSRDEMFKFFII
jgi:hypothetical protein